MTKLLIDKCRQDLSIGAYELDISTCAYRRAG